MMHGMPLSQKVDNYITLILVEKEKKTLSKDASNKTSMKSGLNSSGIRIYTRF